VPRADEVSNPKAQIEALQDQPAALEQQVQLLQQADRTSFRQRSAAVADPPDLPYMVQPPSRQHGFFERKPRDRTTFYLPGGALATYGNLDASVDAITKGIAGKIGPDGNPSVGNMGWMPAGVAPSSKRERAAPWLIEWTLHGSGFFLTCPDHRGLQPSDQVWLDFAATGVL